MGAITDRMRFRAFKYISPLVVYITAWFSFSMNGFICFLPVIYVLVLLPVLELFLPAADKNLAAAEEEMSRHDKIYDYVLYLFVFIEISTLFYFLHSMQDVRLSGWDKFGRIFTMGTLCVFSLNVGHELGHRVKKEERVLAKIELMTSLYMHFIISHNKGHHKNVATEVDPSSAKLGESIYRFWPRTIFFSYISAWKIANRDVRRRGKAEISIHNEMIQTQFIQLGFVILIASLFGGWITLYFSLAALDGILLLEMTNYIEHYGLSRRQTAADKYERIMPHHSWNSSHVFGRIVLFELSRHSDHHYVASRKYQVLRNHEDAPQIPTGYPGMMLLALMPSAWFFVMDRRLETMKRIKENTFDSSTGTLYRSD